MDITDNSLEMLAELDRLRLACGMSYQDVADACGVAKSTIHRVLTGSTEPTVALIQSIAAAVQYKPPAPDIFPTDLTLEAYVSYLKELVLRTEKEHDRHVQQLHSHYNKLRRQARREKLVWMAIAIALIVTFVALFLYDFTHLDRGWIQAASAAGLIQSALSRAFLSINNLWRSLWML